VKAISPVKAPPRLNVELDSIGKPIPIFEWFVWIEVVVVPIQIILLVLLKYSPAGRFFDALANAVPVNDDPVTAAVSA